MGESNGSSVRPSDQLAVQRLLAEYCRHVDDGRAEAVVDLFVEDGVFEYSGERLAGRLAVAGFFGGLEPERRGRHSCGYPIVEFDNNGHVHAVTDFIFFGRMDGSWFIKVVGRYHDLLRRGSDGFRFVERRVVIVDPM